MTKDNSIMVEIKNIQDNLKEFKNENKEEHEVIRKCIESNTKSLEERVSALETFKIQAKVILWILGIIITGVAIPLIYKFCEIKIFS